MIKDTKSASWSEFANVLRMYSKMKKMILIFLSREKKKNKDDDIDMAFL